MYKKYICRGIAMLALLAVIVSCEKDTLPFNLAPTVTTGKTDGIYRTGVMSVAGRVDNPNGYSVAEYGIEYSLYQSFAESTLVKAKKMDSKGNFTVTIDNLEPGVGYFYRTYVFGGYNTIYGETRNFTTVTTSAPQFSAETVVSNIDLTSFHVEATLLDDGGSEGGVQMSAFLYIPAEKDVKDLLVSTQNVNIKSVDNFSTTIDNLYTNTRYAVRPMAVSGSGIGYGAITYVTTTATDATLLSTCTLSDTTTNSITVKALMLSAGTHPIVEAGFCYSSENEVPTIQNLTVQTKLQGTGLKATLTDLNAKTTYYIRAYAKNDQGTVSYSETIEYVVAEYKDLDVRTDNADEISATSARLWGYVRDNNVPVSERGFCWSTSEFQPEEKKVMDNVTYVVVDANEEKYSYTLNAESNTTYYFCAYAKNSDGEVYYGDVLSFTTLEAPEAEAIDLGLSVLWASFNVGATCPEGSGGRYAWGETEEKDSYDSGNYTVSGSSSKLESLGIIDAYGNLTAAYDAATTNWGGDWRMPTSTEIEELIRYCTWEWQTVNGVKGYRVTGANGNSIFLPDIKWYWTATPHTLAACANLLILDPDRYSLSFNYRYLGLSVRPVKDNPNFQGNHIDVYTDNADEVTATSARLWGHLGDGRVAVNERGFCWSTSAFQPEDKKVMDNITYVAVNSNEAKYSYTLDATSETTYYFCAYVKNTYDVVYYGDVVSFTTPPKANTGEYEAVDLGLSVRWATCNVGAESPEEYGDYFAWGETEEKTNYAWSTYKWCNGSYNSLTKYCTDSSFGTVDNKKVLDPEDDAATANWGGSWRMPTLDELEELCNKCSWKWTLVNGVSGQKVTGPNGNSIFLPAAGYRDGGGVYHRGSYGYYWSGAPEEHVICNACGFSFDAGYWYWNFCNYRSCGHPVRPVTN